MKIWLFQIGEPLPFVEGARKMRTALLAEELASRGHRVTWWASKFDHVKKHWLPNTEPTVRHQPNLDIILLKGCGYRKNVSLARIIDHRLVAKRFREMAKSMPKPDLVLASMPSYDLALEAVGYAKAHNIPSVIDIRDQWPDIFADQAPKLLRPLIRHLLFHERDLLRRALRDSTAITSMIGQLLDWGLTYANRNRTASDGVFYLGCPPYKKVEPSASEKIAKILPHLKNKTVVTFIGTFGNYYNPVLLAKVARRFEGRPVAFLIGGDGDFFEQVAAEAKGTSNIFMTGWLNNEDIAAALSVSDVGVCPATQVIDAFPNKAFVYLSAGLPLISSCQGDLKDLLEKYMAGLYFHPGDEEGLSRCIGQMIEGREQLERLKKNALDLFNAELNSQNIYAQFSNYLERLPQPKPAAPTAERML